MVIFFVTMNRDGGGEFVMTKHRVNVLVLQIINETVNACKGLVSIELGRQQGGGGDSGIDVERLYNSFDRLLTIAP